MPLNENGLKMEKIINKTKPNHALQSMHDALFPLLPTGPSCGNKKVLWWVGGLGRKFSKA